MSSKENRKDPVWWTDGNGNDEYVNGYKDWCGACKADTLRSKHGRCTICVQLAEERADFYANTRDDYAYNFRR